jgi:enoyl-[acyl-carrier protein] reductase I
MTAALAQRRILVTGVADENSLALEIARVLQREGADLVCTGLGPDVPTVVLDASLDGSLAEMTDSFAQRNLMIDGLVHAIAMDRTIRGGIARPLIEVTHEEFLDCMSVSAYSLIGLLRALLEGKRLREGGSVVSLSYLGVDRVMSHAYRNIGVAKAVARAAETAPLGNASPEALALEVAHLMRPGLEITGEVRHVDEGYNTVG